VTCATLGRVGVIMRALVAVGMVVAGAALHAQGPRWVSTQATERWVTGSLPPELTVRQPAGVNTDIRVDSIVSTGSRRVIFADGGPTRLEFDGGRLRSFVTPAMSVPVLDPGDAISSAV
jgi:hypothetical protein